MQLSIKMVLAVKILGRGGLVILKISKIKIECDVHYEREIATINTQQSTSVSCPPCDLPTI